MADSHEDDPFSSIPATFWWCVVTLTTVGYGDAYPLTAYGKLAAAFTMIASVVITALPISVIGANFTQRWLDHKADERDESRRRQTKSRVLGEFARVLGAHVEVVDAVLAATEAAHEYSGICGALGGVDWLDLGAIDGEIEGVVPLHVLPRLCGLPCILPRQPCVVVHRYGPPRHQEAQDHAD